MIEGMAERPESHSAKAPALVIALTAVPFVYVISAVPVTWLCVWGYLPGWVVDIYDPLRAVPGFNEFLRWGFDCLP